MVIFGVKGFRGIRAFGVRRNCAKSWGIVLLSSVQAGPGFCPFENIFVEFENCFGVCSLRRRQR